MKRSFVLFAIFWLANAQEPVPCESPKQWEARYFAYSRGSLIEESGSITYDEVEERIRFVVREDDNGQEIDSYEIIQLFLKGIEYRYDYITGQCINRTLDEPFRPFGVPSDATSYGQFYIGTSGVPDAGMLVNVFGGEVREGERYETTVTAGACIPVNDIFVRREEDGFEETNIDFYDVIAQIPDPDVFNPPDACL